MPLPSPYQNPIPQTSLLTYLFPSSLPNSPLYIDAEDPSQSLSLAETHDYVRKLGYGLQEQGLKKGDVVMVMSRNSHFIPVLYLGIVAAGGIWSGVNVGYGVDETAYQIRSTTCTFIFVEPSLLPTVLGAAYKTSFLTSRIFLFSKNPSSTQSNIHDWRTILGSSVPRSWTWPSLTPTESLATVAALNYSSGTTGLPKGVMITHANLIANTEQSIYMRNLEQSYAPSTRPSERWLGFLPLYHAFGQLWSIVAAARTNTPTYFMPEFKFEKFLSHIQTHKITHLQTAPPVLVMLAKRPETQKYDISSLRNILCGAAPLSRDLQNEVSDRFRLNVVQTWGMTELTCSMLHVPGGRDDRTGCAGLIDPNSEVKLVDPETGKEADVGKRGEMRVKGPNVCLGYWRDEGATRGLFDEDGFLRSGDVGVRDEEGRFWIVDRLKELIKVKGFQVAPAELESLLLGHEVVGDVGVVGIKGDHEELPRAYISLKPTVPPGSVSEEDIIEWVKPKVAKHKWLTGGVVFIDEVPKSQSGKIQRKFLREWAKKDERKFGAKL